MAGCQLLQNSCSYELAIRHLCWWPHAMFMRLLSAVSLTGCWGAAATGLHVTTWVGPAVAGSPAA